MNEINCPKCGTLNHASNKFCTTCGNNLLAVTTLVCQNCGQRNSIQLVYCDNCGVKLVQSSPLEDEEAAGLEGGGSIPGPFELPARNPGETGDLDPDNLLEFMRSQPADDSGNPFDIDDLGEVELPDWMQADAESAAAEPEPPAPAAEEEIAELPEPDWVDESALEDDSLDDDWLSELASDSGAGLEMAEEDDFDWLSAMPETADELEAALPDQDPEADVSKDFDWSVLTPEPASNPRDTSSFQDWLKPITGELVDPEAESDPAESTTPADDVEALDPLTPSGIDALSPSAELPDWLSDTDSQEVVLGLEGEEELQELPVSGPLTPDPEAPSFKDVMDEDALPTWIAEHEQDVIMSEEAEPTAAPAEEEFDSWMHDSSPLDQPDVPDKEPEIESDPAEGLDAWLSVVEEEVDEVEDPTAVPTFDPLDFDWPEEVAKVDAEDIEDTSSVESPGFTEWLSVLDDGEPETEISPPIAASEPETEAPATAEPIGFTEWLSSSEADEAVEPEPEAEAETAVPSQPEPDAEPTVDAWLDELEAELDDIEVPAAPAAGDWLDEAAEAAEPATPEESVEAEFPDWLTDVQTGDKLIVDDTPPWEAEPAEANEVDFEAPLASEAEALDFLSQVEELVETEEPGATPLTATGPLDEANVPAWLEEFESEAELAEDELELEEEPTLEFQTDDPLSDFDGIFADDADELPAAASQADAEPDFEADLAILADLGLEPEEDTLEFDAASFALEALAEADGDEPLFEVPEADELLPDWLAEDDLAPAAGDSFALFEGESDEDLGDLFEPDIPLPAFETLGSLDELDDLRIDYDSLLSADAVLEEDILDLGDDAFVLDAKAAAILADMPPAEEEPLSVEGEGRVDVSDLLPELPKAEIPDWLKEHEPDLTQPAGQPRAHVGGPLDGLLGVVEIPPVLLGASPEAATTPPAPPANLAEQQQHATLLQQIARGVPPAAVVPSSGRSRFNPWPLVRILLSLLLLGVILTGFLLPGFIPLDFGRFPLTPGLSAANSSLENLSNDVVLLAVDYTPAQAAELDQVASPLLAQLAAGDNQVWLVSQFPTGVPTGQSLLDAQPFALDSVSLGYVPGKEVGIRQLSQCLEVEATANCTPFLAQPPDSLALNQVAAIVLLTAERDSFQTWIEQVGAQHDLPLIVGSSQGLAPIAQPYLASGQLAGLVSGVNEAEVYTSSFGSDEDAAAGLRLENQMLARLFAVLALILGGLFGLLPISRP